VIKGGVPLDHAEHYQSKMMGWLKSFNLGFDPKDKSTGRPRTFPSLSKAGKFWVHKHYIVVADS
jgi:hypothetical protein